MSHIKLNGGGRKRSSSGTVVIPPPPPLIPTHQRSATSETTTTFLSQAFQQQHPTSSHKIVQIKIVDRADKDTATNKMNPVQGPIFIPPPPQANNDSAAAAAPNIMADIFSLAEMQLQQSLQNDNAFEDVHLATSHRRSAKEKKKLQRFPLKGQTGGEASSSQNNPSSGNNKTGGAAAAANNNNKRSTNDDSENRRYLLNNLDEISNDEAKKWNETCTDKSLFVQELLMSMFVSDPSQQQQQTTTPNCTTVDSSSTSTS